ncbi:MaoC family dehydratase N-terminal domain-containing protein [Streptomyces sp. NBC_01356]|uniref:FAS1-like dehydratase domain-containing protein n=1 Tax=Streptomyces sp. NBC_01356 TaxID=2903836 RepID=UPI002E373ADC|nr:MaoC family dehydratase N-terminal domain-containing protein [Streptomyces sp. NBC_01356]
MTYVTDEIRSLIGLEGPVATAPYPLGQDEVRRFVQAAMEDSPVHSDRDSAIQQGFKDVVATPLFPVHVLRRQPGTPDPFSRFAEEPDWDGLEYESAFAGLPPIRLPLRRVLNGGVSAEFFKLAEIGDVVSSQSRYLDISERSGSRGAMVLVKIETTYTNQDGQPLVRVLNTIIMR